MPHMKDLRCGYGWYDINLSHFYEWMETSQHTEVEVSNTFSPYSHSEFDYHQNALHDEIEMRMNEFLDYRIFNQSREPLDDEDELPKNFERPYTYIYYHLLRFCKNHASWYILKKTD